MSEKMINCKACGASIAKSAKNCPNCGLANKKPVFKKWWFWVGVLVIAVLFIAVGGEDTTPKETENNTIYEEAKPKPTEMNENNDIADTYALIGETSDMPFSVREKSRIFINEHPEYFPGNESNKGAISDFVDAELTYAHLSKNISKHGDKLMEIYGDVIDIEESDDGGITYVHIYDYEGKSYILYYLGSLDNVFEESYVGAYALPLDIITFENMNNTYTEAVVCAACYVFDFSVD